MKAKNKAKELVGYYFNEVSDANPLEDILVAAKKCALICIDEMIKELPKRFDSEEIYWEEVKQEIEKL
tara:strand:- start:248 stop:451 length:204 start_codon:yes stop_codon:yes gene_type:complete